MHDFIPQMAPNFGHEEADALHEYVMGGGWMTEHEKTREFERAIAAYTGARHCIATNNGTVSLALALWAIGIEPGDKVIVPNYTMIATANAVRMVGATPVFVDVEADSLCMDIIQAKKLVGCAMGLILVTANGRTPRAGIEQFVDLCKENGLQFIEDAAQSLGSRVNGGRYVADHCGRMGAIGSFSFSAPKIISTGQGGALITDDDELAHRIRRLKDFGRASGGTDIHDTIGWNFKFTDLQAVVGLEQMKKLPGRVLWKKSIAQRYCEMLSGIAEVKLFAHDPKYEVPWFIDATVERRDELADFLKSKGIGTRPMYPPINAQKAYRIAGSFPVSERVGRDGLWLPSSCELTFDDVEYVCQNIRNFYAGAVP